MCSPSLQMERTARCISNTSQLHVLVVCCMRKRDAHRYERSLSLWTAIDLLGSLYRQTVMPASSGHRGIMTGGVYFDIFAHDMLMIDVGVAATADQSQRTPKHGLGMSRKLFHMQDLHTELELDWPD